MAKNRKRPGGVSHQGAKGSDDDGNYNTGNGEGWKGPDYPAAFSRSGNHDTPHHHPSAEVKRRAEYIAREEVGDAREWEQFVAQAAGDVSWDKYEAWLGRRGWQFVEGFDYTNDDGAGLYETRRYNYRLFPRKKMFVARHREGQAWVRGAGPVRVPYNCVELLARPEDEINLVEGEKGVERLKKLKLLASCVQGQNWTSDVAQFFVRRTVNVVMDNDDAGRENAETACEQLRKVNATFRVIDLPDLPPQKGLDDWLEQHSVEEYQALVAKSKPEREVGVISPTEWADRPVPARIFLVPPLIPEGNVALLYGDGGLGKSLLALQLAAARALKLLWLGLKTLPGRTLLLSAEDDVDELHRRLAAICLHYQASLGDLSAIRLIDLVGQDAVIGELSRNGRIIATELYRFMMREIAKFAPGLVIVDALADSFAGDENNRTQARQFISMLRRPAHNHGCAFLTVAHPSISGITTGRGTSGSTGWSNSVRARMYFETVEVVNGERN